MSQALAGLIGVIVGACIQASGTVVIVLRAARNEARIDARLVLDELWSTIWRLDQTAKSGSAVHMRMLSVDVWNQRKEPGRGGPGSGVA
jgi:hypothetical protein